MGAAFRAHLGETLRDLGFLPTRADPDVWRRPAVKPDGFEYYELILCYVDDLLAMSHAATKVLEAVKSVFKFKDDKIEAPDIYLGAQLDTMVVDEMEGWTMSLEKYVIAAVENVESELQKTGQRLPTKCRTPLSSNYRPELDTSAELKADGVQCYQEMIGILWWAVELG